MAARAVAEHGAGTLGDLRMLSLGMAVLPPDVARSWNRIRQLDLQALAGVALASAAPRSWYRPLRWHAESPYNLGAPTPP